MPKQSAPARCPKCRKRLDAVDETVDAAALGREPEAPADVAAPAAEPVKAAAEGGEQPAVAAETPDGAQPETFKQALSLVRGIRKAGTKDWQSASQEGKPRSGSSTGSGRPAQPAADESGGYSPKAGEVIGTYRLVMPVGRGSFGAVWKGTNLKTSEDVAIKFLSESRERENSSYRARFLREARAARRVRHPNLVAVLDAGTHEGRPFIVQEYISGESLGEIAKRDGALPEATILNVAQAVAQALQAAHAERIIHRDVKPDNILVSADGPIKLIDLGLAKDRGVPHESSLTAPETALGTPRYMAPEQARDARSADERSDLYSLGATLYHLATGKLPFEGGMLETIVCHATEPLVPPRNVRPELSEGLSRLICHLMAKRPENRTQNTDQFLDMLRRVRWGLTIPDSPNANDPYLLEGTSSKLQPASPVSPWVLRPAYKLAAVIAAVVLAVAVAISLLIRIW